MTGDESVSDILEKALLQVVKEHKLKIDEVSVRWMHGLDHTITEIKVTGSAE